MALPKLNEAPSYQIAIPSTGDAINFRPYLVKEEKVLMMAFETGDQKQALKAIVDTLQVCIEEPIDVRKLTTFDIEYIFTQIRAKSVGEASTVLLTCNECGNKNEYSIDVSKVEVSVPKDEEKVVQLTPSISVELKYPSYEAVMGVDLNAERIELGFAMVIHCIDAIITNDERIDCSTVAKKEVAEFVESMTTEQFQKMSVFLDGMPQMTHEGTFECGECGEKNNVLLRGISDFLS